MTFEEYKQEVDRLYHEYLKLSQNADGVISLPTAAYRLPGAWRPQYESFEFLVNLLDSPADIVSQIEEFKQDVLNKRMERIKALEAAFPRKAVIANPPTRADGHSKDYAQVINQAEQALEVYLHKGTRRETAAYVFGFSESDPNQDQKNAERQVRQYHDYAKMLKEAATTGTFFDALEKPLPKK
jgi:hypothetical protein